MAIESPLPLDLRPRDDFIGGNQPSRIDSCSECGTMLGLVAPSYETPASTWLCGGCGSAYFAAAAPPHLQPARCSVRPAELHQVISAAVMHPMMRDGQLPHRDLHRVLKFLATYEHGALEKRDDQRFPIAMPVLSVPLSRSFRVAGPAAEMATVNISRRGGALLDSHPCRAPYLVLDLTVPGIGPLLLILEVLRLRSLMSAYEIAGRWHSRVVVSHAPSPSATMLL